MDLRLPIGLFFSLLAIILLITARLGPDADSAVNAFCGAAMGVFGAVMLWLARRKT
jgi:hypothetical protein